LSPPHGIDQIDEDVSVLFLAENPFECIVNGGVDFDVHATSQKMRGFIEVLDETPQIKNALEAPLTRTW
jgi:hypothetical protein